MLPTPRPKRRHCAPPQQAHYCAQSRTTAGYAQRPTRQCAQNRTPAGHSPRSARPTARKTARQPGMRNAQPVPLHAKPHSQQGTRNAQPARNCAQDRTPAGYAQRSTRPPLRTRPHSPQGRRNAQPVHHCAQDHPASRVRAMLNPPATAQNRTAVGQPPRSARPPLRAKPHSPWGMRHVQPVPTARKTAQLAEYAPLQPAPTARKTAQPAGHAPLQPARHCAQNRTARRVFATLSP